MRLTRLYLNGFKSFGEPTHLIFEPGITVIVGPNGSGKSNIVDAIKWLMGEKSVKNLRGSVTEDLIFAGSGKRKRSNMAEVLMLLEDENEIEVPGQGRFRSVEIRRIYHRGERSTFYINNSRALEREVETFFGSSVRLTRSYAIIEQGEVERIPSMKPEGLARMIQDAAQVGVFLSNKVTAIANLEEARKELEKLEPFLNELKERRETLAVELERVLEYRRLASEKKKLQIAILLEDYKRYKGIVEEEERNFRKFDEELGLLRDERDSLQREIEELSDRLQDLTMEYEEKNRALQRLVNEIYQRKSKLSKIGTELKVLEDEVSSSRRSIDFFGREIEEKTSKMEEDKAELERVAAELSRLEEDVRRIAEAKKNLEDELASLRERIRLKNDEFVQVRSEYSRVEAKLSALEDRQRRLEREREKIQSKIGQIKETIESLVRSVEEKEKKLNEVVARVRELEGILPGLKENRRKLSEEEKNVGEQLAGEKLELSRVQLEIDKINDEINSHADLGESVAEFLKWANSSGWKASPLAEKIELKDESKGFLQFVSDIAKAVVVEELDEEILIRWLEKGGGKVALTTSDTDFKDIIGELRVYDSLEELLSADEDGYHPRGVVRKGKLIYAGGDERSGARPLLLRKRLAELREHEHTIGKKIEELEAEKQRLKNLIAQSSNRIADVERELQGRRRERERLELELRQLKRERGEKELELKSLHAELEEITGVAEKIRVELAEGRERLLSLKDKVEELQSEKSEIDEKIGGMEKELQRISSEYERLSRTLWEKRKQKEELERDIEKLQNDVRILKGKIERTRREIDSKLEKIAHLTEEKNGLSEELDGYLERESVLKGEIEKFDERLKEINDTLRKMRSRLNRIERNIKKVENGRDLSKERLEEARGNLKSVLVRLTELTDAALGELMDNDDYKLNIPMEEAVNRVAELTEMIERLGEINHRAPQEYEIIGEQIKELEEKRNDILEAIEKHMKAIEVIERRAKETFFGMLDKIEQNFNRLYGYLTGGGSARFVYDRKLTLEEMKVDIQLSLPGKSVSSIFALSGGEKALTSIALILSFFMVNPAPFCVLDEVDAPLDVANTERFNNLLRELSATTQFIIVTHNHKTMEVADRIYGVSMEDGVSRVVSLALKEYIGG